MPNPKVPQKLEDMLRRGVNVVGGAIEKAIGHAERLSEGLKKGSTFAQPVLSLEGQLPLPKIKEIISQTVDKFVVPVVPGLVDKTSLEIREGASSLAKVFNEKGSSVAVHIDIGASGGSYGKPEARLISLRSESSRLPFEDGFFDVVVANLATQYQGDIVKATRELSRVLSISGEATIVDFHPFGQYAQWGNVRLRPVESTIRGIEDYYKLCKTSQLRIIGIREAFFDEALRPCFVTEGEKSAFRMLKDTPLLIFLQVKKGG
jgi:SAM-dependent methyltransferase